MITKMHHRLGRVRFRDLELLLALADTGSLRQAATVLGVSQPALSKSLREIEDAFGVPLYVRSRNPSGHVELEHPLHVKECQIGRAIKRHLAHSDVGDVICHASIKASTRL